MEVQHSISIYKFLFCKKIQKLATFVIELDTIESKIKTTYSFTMAINTEILKIAVLSLALRR